MAKNLTEIRDMIILAALPDLDGQAWSWQIILDAGNRCKLSDDMPQAVFPNGLTDAVAHFGDLLDRRMLAKLNDVSAEGLRVRDRIRTAVMARFEAVEEISSQAGLKATLSYWAVPIRSFQGQRVVWRSCDRIWSWAGDESRNYNHYTKRGLLASIFVATSLVWADDESDGFVATREFLDRRIENVMEIGKVMGKIGSFMPDTARNFSRSK